ncbi:hypothetical protein DPK65_23035, partial [Salmonella enterica subsp. enterica]|nr:hypothetical protein [Salmonella enterica subsp. enterica]
RLGVVGIKITIIFNIKTLYTLSEFTLPNYCIDGKNGLLTYRGFYVSKQNFLKQNNFTISPGK